MGGVYAEDEMDIAGAFLTNREDFKDMVTKSDGFMQFLSDNQQIFDNIYQTGLGFRNEIGIEEKRLRKPVETKPSQIWKGAGSQ